MVLTKRGNESSTRCGYSVDAVACQIGVANDTIYRRIEHKNCPPIAHVRLDYAYDRHQ